MKKGEHAAGKGPADRLAGRSLTAYKNSVLWDNLEKKKKDDANPKYTKRK